MSDRRDGIIRQAVAIGARRYHRVREALTLARCGQPAFPFQVDFAEFLHQLGAAYRRVR